MKNIYLKQKNIYLHQNKKAGSRFISDWNEISKQYFQQYSGIYPTIQYDNGDKYEGEVKDDKPHGQGTFYYKNGDRYEDQFENGKKHGKGTFFYKNGDRYEGQFENGKKHGQGTYYYTSGARYEGEWKDGKSNGQGTYYYKSGARYKGEWKDDKREGRGNYFYKNGDRYEGQYKDGKKHGQGTFFYNNGNRYEGEFKDGLANGQGTYFYKNGDRYIGEFKDNKKNGQGTYYHDEKLRYKGEWENDIKININQATHYDEFEKIIQNYEDYKKEAIKNLNLDLTFLQKFMQNNKKINSGTKLYNLAEEFLYNQKLHFSNRNYIINKEFLYTDAKELLFIYYLLALFKEDCSLEQFVMDPRLDDDEPNYFLYNNDLKKMEIDDINNLVNKCCKDGKKYIFILLSLKYSDGSGHETSLFIDTTKNIIEYFDPNYTKGSAYTSYIYHDKNRIEEMIKHYFAGYTYNNLENISFLQTIRNMCFNYNKIGFQSRDIRNKKKDINNIEKDGYCVNWTFLYLYYRLQNTDKSQEEVIDKLYELLSTKLSNFTIYTTFTSIIRSISLFQKFFEIIFEHYYNVYSISQDEFNKEAINIFTKETLLN